MKHGIRFESSSVQRLLSTALELSITSRLLILIGNVRDVEMAAITEWQQASSALTKNC